MLRALGLMPREDKFFTLMRALAAKAEEGAGHLKIFVENEDPDQKQRAGAAMTVCRSEAKALAVEITKKLCQTFITPFDREDIQNLSDNLYKITKMVEKVHTRLTLHGIASDRGDFSQQIDLIVLEAAAMKATVDAMTSGKGSEEILKHVTVLRDLENKGDDVLSRLLVELFREEKDARALILRKDIYDMLEKVIDCYRDAAGVALQIVLKHS